MAITLLEMLLEASLLTPGQCDEALQSRVFFGGRIGTNLIELGFIGEKELARFLSRKLAVPYVPPEDLLNIPPETIALLPKDLALQYQVVPLRLENRRLSVATADPSALTAIEEIAFITGHLIKPLITPEVRLVQALGKYYRYEVGERYQHIIDLIEEQRRKKKGAETGQPGPGKKEPELPEEPLPPSDAKREGNDEAPWRARIERYSIDHLSRALARAEDPGEVADTLLRYLAQEFDRAALFLLRREMACGWRAAKGGTSVTGFKEVVIPLSGSSLLGKVAKTGSPYCGPIPATSPDDRIAAVMGTQGGETLLVPVQIGTRTVLILYAGDAGRHPGNRLGELRRLAGKAALAFEILIAREKILVS